MARVIADVGGPRKASKSPMLNPLFRAIEQLDDPAILRVLINSLLLSAACFGLLCAGDVYGLHHALLQTGWLAWVAGVLGGFAAVAAALWLFLPLAVVIASLFMEPVCRAVERRWYPALPESRGAHLATQMWDGVVVGLLVLGLSCLSLVLAIVIPGLGLVLGWGITAWALGRGMFVAVAMRRMGRMEASVLYRRHRPAVLLQGAALALAGYVPVVNLLVPVLGTACMVHVLMQSKAEAAG
jgi:uncharacterized protein involved in cysteine biosynthesis